MIMDKKVFKRDILDKFRALIEAEESALPSSWIESRYEELNRLEKKMLSQAIQDLIASGILKRIKGKQEHLTLTPKGEHLIYRSIASSGEPEAEREAMF